MQRGLAIIFLALTSFATAQTPDYKNANLPVEQRVGDLLKRMTLEEKVDQLAGGRRRLAK
jgi:beta-glucosidase